MPSDSASTFILLVDDDALLRQALQDLLEIVGYQVQAAANAHDALRILSSAAHLPDLIVSDFRLPGLDGGQFFDHVHSRESWRHVPFIFISGSQQDLNHSWICWEPLVRACLVKPFAIEDFFDAVAQATTAAQAG